MKTPKTKKISIRLETNDVLRLIEGLKVLCQDLEFYGRRADEKQAFDLAIERFNCKDLQRMLESKLEEHESSNS